MSDSSDSGKKPFKAFSEEQRKQLQKRVKQTLERAAEEAAQPADSDSATHLQSSDGGRMPPESVGDKTDPDGGTATPQASGSRPFRAIGAEEREELRRKVEAKVEQKQRLDELRRRLLSMAGKQAVIDDGSPYSQLLMDSRQTWNSFDVNLIAGPEMTATRSVARLWEQSPDYFKVVVGYALDAAGTWREHAWLLARGTVHDVTMKHAVYYGVPLSDTQARVFVKRAGATK